jgi:hypothetical protein
MGSRVPGEGSFTLVPQMRTFGLSENQKKKGIARIPFH